MHRQTISASMTAYSVEVSASSDLQKFQIALANGRTRRSRECSQYRQRLHATRFRESIAHAEYTAIGGARRLHASLHQEPFFRSDPPQD